MRRHRALAVIAASLILFASQAGGQQPVHRVRVLSNSEGAEANPDWLDGLRERGYVVGQNLQIEYRYSQGRTERVPALVAELVAFRPEVIVAGPSPNAVAVRAAAPNIPLVFVNVGDPVAVGLVENLAHPGGNVTGFATTVPEGFVGKQLQLLKAIIPQASRIAVLVNPTNPVHRPELLRLPEIGRLLRVELFVVVELTLGFGFETTTAPTGRGVPIGTHRWFGSFPTDTSVPCASLLNKSSVSIDHNTLSAGFACHLAKIRWNS